MYGAFWAGDVQVDVRPASAAPHPQCMAASFSLLLLATALSDLACLILDIPLPLPTGT